MLACILPLVLYLHSFITVSSFPPGHPENLSDHICSLAELLHAHALQQLEVALLGSLAAKQINVLLASLQSTSSTQHHAVLLQPSITTSVSPPPPPLEIL